jgi:hypothetical protein
MTDSGEKQPSLSHENVKAAYNHLAKRADQLTTISEAQKATIWPRLTSATPREADLVYKLCVHHRNLFPSKEKMKSKVSAGCNNERYPYHMEDVDDGLKVYVNDLPLKLVKILYYYTESISETTDD